MALLETSLVGVNYLSTINWPVIASMTTQILLIVFHAVNAYISRNTFKTSPGKGATLILRLFFIFNIICCFWRVDIFYHVCTYGPDMTPLAQIVSPILIVATFSPIWFLVPMLNRLPSIEEMEAVVNELNLKIAELEQEKLEKESVQASLLQAQKMEAIGQLTGGIAHDFNNLLLAISGNLELIRLNPRSDRVDRWVGTGIDAVARAAHLAAQLLTFSRIQRLQLKEVELCPLMKNVQTMIARTIGPDIKIVLNDCENVLVMTDPVQLELAILNLSFNSRDAMTGSGLISLSANIVEDRIEIDVSDTGSGIPEDIASRIFEPFFTTKDIGKGTGLGLSMVYGLANQCDGDVYIKRTSPKGTTITLSLPFTKIEGESSCVEEEYFPAPTCSSRDILLIDDDADVRETLSEILELLGHKVVTAVDGPDALTKLKDNKPDLVLVDYAMPIMNGAEVIKAAKTIHTNLNVAFITGYSESAFLEGEIVLKKPFKIKDIEQLLRSIFNCQ